MTHDTKQQRKDMRAALAAPGVAPPRPPTLLRSLTACDTVPAKAPGAVRCTELGAEATLTMVAPRPVPLITRLLACRARTSRATLLQWVRSGADVGWQNVEGGTALMVAARYGEIDTVRFLVGQGARVNHCDKRGLSALCWAVWHGHRSVAAFLKSRGATLSHTAVHGAAVRFGHTASLCLLQQLGAPAFNGEPQDELVTLAAQHGQQDCLEFLLAHGHRAHGAAWRAAVATGHFRLATSLERRLSQSGLRRLTCMWGIRHARYWWHRRRCHSPAV